MPDSLTALEAHRNEVIAQFGKLGDLRRGSITATGGRCGNPNCHCHGEKDPGHGPHPRLTYKVQGKNGPKNHTVDSHFSMPPLSVGVHSPRDVTHIPRKMTAPAGRNKPN